MKGKHKQQTHSHHMSACSHLRQYSISLTTLPQESCDDFDTTLGSDEEDTFINTYAPAVAARLNGLAAPSFNWTASDVFAAQTLCGYDVVIRNYSSPFCSLFSESEWLSWEYGTPCRYSDELAAEETNSQ
jgi:acid phosphatase